MATLTLALQNQTTSQNVNAYITGQAIDKSNALFLLQSDGKTGYYPTSPSATGQKLTVNCAIPLGAPGNTVYCTIPHLAGARMWFCVNDTLDFLLNPGPGLVEPTVTSNTDSNINKQWDFCEFTFNSSELYANITYVDFVSLPVSLTLSTQSGATQHISGMNASGFQSVVSGLQQQTSSDNQPWGSLVVNANGSPLRVLSPNSYLTFNNSAFSGYFDSAVDQAWKKYQNGTTLSVDTQASWGKVNGTFSNGTLNFDNNISFAEPAAADIFSCSTGPFAGGTNVSDEQLNIGARLAAALNRSTLADYASQPDGANPSEYYKTSPTNHYARIVHAANLDGRGYTFPYDDVTSSQTQDQSGYVSAGDAKLLTICVGGSNATNDVNEATKRQAALMQSIPKADNSNTTAPPAAGTPAKGGDDSKAAEPKPQQPAQPSQPTQPSTPAEKPSTPGCCASLLARFRRKKQ